MLDEAEGRYSAIIPAPDVAFGGDTVPEALLMVERPLAACLECRGRHSDPLPGDSETFTLDMRGRWRGMCIR